MRRRMRIMLAVAFGLALAAPARSDEALLIGVWDIRVTGDTADGDHGVISIRRDGDRLVGDMTFTDVSASVSATQTCLVTAAGASVGVACTVLTPLSGYAPDDLDLTIRSYNVLVGRLMSTTTGDAVLTRRVVPLS